MADQITASGWLWEPNLDEEDAKALATYEKYIPTKCVEGGQIGKVIRVEVDPKVVKKQMKRVCGIGKEEFVMGHLDKVLKMDRERTKIKGIAKLAKAAETGNPPLLRKGQVIFGTTSLSNARGQEGLR